MMRCVTQGMCSPHGGCKDPAFNPEWDRLKAAQESLREHMQVIAKQNDELSDLRARLAERDALLREMRNLATAIPVLMLAIPDPHDIAGRDRHIDAVNALIEKCDGSLSASAEPSAPVERDETKSCDELNMENGSTFMGEPNPRHSIEWYREGIAKHWKTISDQREIIERLTAALELKP